MSHRTCIDPGQPHEEIVIIEKIDYRWFCTLYSGTPFQLSHKDGTVVEEYRDSCMFGISDGYVIPHYSYGLVPNVTLSES